MKQEFQWQGRQDGIGDAHLRMYQVVNQSEHAEFALIGFSSDEGVRRNKGRVGAADAPDLIRKKLANLPVHSPVTLKDLGTVVCMDRQLEQAQVELAEKIDLALQKGMKPIVLGGGHEVAFGSFSGLFQYVQKFESHKTIGVVNFDAHLDLRDELQATSGTPFLQAEQLSKQHNKAFHYLCIGVAQHSNTKILFETAQRLNCSLIYDTEIEDSNFPALQAKIDTFIEHVDILYVTVDLDVFSSFIAPGVSAPAVTGINIKNFEKLMHYIQKSGKIALLDIAECNPLFDQDQRTVQLAAYIVYSYIFNDT